jgi:hypothetical protein
MSRFPVQINVTATIAKPKPPQKIGLDGWPVERKATKTKRSGG